MVDRKGWRGGGWFESGGGQCVGLDSAKDGPSSCDWPAILWQLLAPAPSPDGPQRRASGCERSAKRTVTET